MKYSWTWVAISLSLGLVGCQTAEQNPWSVQQYHPPSDHKPVPQATYAPMPSILPRVNGSTTETIEPGSPDELEQILRELEID